MQCKSAPEAGAEQAVYVGIDVCKAWLDVYRIMAHLKLQYITKDRDRHGNVRFYFRKPGKPKIRLHGLPGSEEFMAAYKEALSETGCSEAKTEKCFEWLCGRYYGSPYFRALEPETRRRKRVVLDEICDTAVAGGRKLGSAPFASMKRAHVRKLRDKKADRPGAADLLVKTVSGLFSWAIKNDLATVNPAEKLERLGGRTEGFYTWTEDDVGSFRKALAGRHKAAAGHGDHALSRRAAFGRGRDRRAA